MNKTITIIGKVIIGLLSVMLIFTWARWFFDPAAMYTLYEVSAETVTGTNMLKANMSSGVLIISVISLLYVFRGRKWLLPAMVSVACMLFTRIGFVFIEGSAPQVLTGIGLESFVLLIWIILYNVDTSES
jgi:hypothetical protein